MIEKILAFENRLLQDRKELNDLIAACTAGTADGLTRMKIQELQREVEMMERELGVLKSIVEYQNTRQQMSETKLQSQQRIVPQSQASSEKRQLQPQAAPPGYQQNLSGVGNETACQQPRKDLENTIGKTIMAVCASVLIFFGLITFAAIALPLLSAEVKLVLMYTASFLLAGTGIIFSFRKRENKWFLSLAGCGMGALYLSLILSKFYFQIMSDIVLYSCIFVWAMGICVLSKMRSKSFLVIGQIGVCISILFGVGFCNYAKDGNRMLFLVVYSILAEMIFYFSHMNREYGKNMVNHIFWAISLPFLVIGGTAGYMEGTIQGTVTGVLLVMVPYGLIAMSLGALKMKEKGNVSAGIFNSLYLLTAYAAFMQNFGNAELLMLVAAILLLAVLEIRIPAKGDIGKILFQCTLFLQLFIASVGCRDFREIFSVALPVVGCLVYGFAQKQNTYKMAGMIYGILFLFVPMNQWLYILWGAAIFAAVAVLLWHYREQYRTWIKAMVYPLLLFFLLISYGKIIGESVFWWKTEEVLMILAVLSAVNIMMQKIPLLQRHPVTGEKEQGMEIETGVIQIVWMFASLVCITNINGTLYHALSILLGAILFVTNTACLLKGKQSGIMGIYVGLKMIVFVEAVLKSFETPGFWMSLAGLLMAVLLVAAGFLAEKYRRQQWKQVRIFGLVLSLLSLAKLVVLDIHYDNMLLRSAGFFAGGILCFGISLIYHMVDKKMDRETED